LETLAAIGQTPADPEPTSDPAGMLELQGRRRAMWEMLQQVSVGARDALVLRYYEGLSYAEIAELLGCSPDAARARVAHGKVQLKRLLTGTGEGAVHEVGIVRPVEVG
jgi:RNA polymerase sigma-70 factor (ECF subfamily)